MNDRIRHILSFLMTVIAAVQFFVPQPVYAEKQYSKEQIYFEDFNSVSDETLASWNQTYMSAAAEKAHWYTSATTFILENHTSETDKALSMNGHVSGQNNYFYFKLPGNIVEDGIDKYEITFDYYANGSWCDWFYLTNKEGASANVNMDIPHGWATVSMTIDLENPSWMIGNYTCPATNMSSILNGSDLTLIIRLHGNAAAGNKIKVDNFRVYKLYESRDYEIYNETVSLYDKFDALQEDLDIVDIKLGKIEIDFGSEELEEIPNGSVILDGDISYETSFENNKLIVLITSPRLEYNTTYTLTVDGLTTKNGKTVIRKEFSFKTLENKPVINDGAYIEYEDFETWTNSTCSVHYNDKYITEGGFRTWTHSGIVLGKDGGKALTPTMSSQSARSLQYYFVPKLENDTFIIEYDYYPGDVENYSDIKFGIFRSKDGYGVTVIPKEGMTAFSGEWGHVKLEVKPSKSTWSVVLTNSSGEVVYEKQNGTWTDSNIAMLDWNIVVTDTSKLSQDANIPKIDNFVVNATYSSEPKLTEKNISIYEGGILQDLSAVSPASNKIIVDFVQRMSPDDMTKDNIYITPKDEPIKPITTTDRYSGGKYEMSPVEYLIPGKTYTVHIKPCSNVSGLTMSDEYRFDFVAGKGTVGTKLSKLTQGGVDVTDLASLSVGSAKLGVFYKNSTGKEYFLHYIIAFYNGNEMVHSVYATSKLGAYAMGQNEEITVSIPNVTREYDEVNIIAWDSFNGMLPVSESLVLK